MSQRTKTMPLPTDTTQVGRRRSRLASVAGLALSVGVGLAITPVTSAHASGSTSSALSRSTATSYVLGFLWSDGYPGVKTGEWHYANRNPALTNQFAAAARALGATVVIQPGERGKTTAFVSNLQLTVDQAGQPTSLLHANAVQIRAFLTPVIEGEGNTDGKVLDDHSALRAKAIVNLLGRVGIRTTVDGTKYFDVYAQQSDWSSFASWPFLSWTRVPGHGN